MISLYDGARWIPVPFAELSLNIGAYTASKPYDIWAYLNAGAVALDSTVWTNATTRATALAYQNGRLIKNGDATRFYLGTIYINGSGGETDDSVIKRNVWNYYNQKMRECYKEDTTGSWTYETASWRNANNSAANRIEYTCGLIGEGGLDLSVSCAIGLDGGVTTGVSIGENGTTPHAKMSGQYATVHNAVATTFSMAQGHLKLAGATGFNYYQWIELGANSGGTTTFYGHIAGRAANIAGYVLG
jgi:hypothetical protein